MPAPLLADRVLPHSLFVDTQRSTSELCAGWSLDFRVMHRQIFVGPLAARTDAPGVQRESEWTGKQEPGSHSGFLLHTEQLTPNIQSPTGRRCNPCCR